MSIGPIGAQSLGPAQMMSAASMVSLYALMSAGPGAAGSAVLVQSLQAQAASTDEMMAAPITPPVTTPAPAQAKTAGPASVPGRSSGHTVDEYA